MEKHTTCYNGEVNNRSLQMNILVMINVFVRKSLEGIVWKNEFEPQDYDSHLILPTCHTLRNSLKLDYANLD
jgi:hypothetical protein